MCPLCGENVDRLIYTFHRATEESILQKIQASHPDWSEEQGACTRCVDLFRAKLLRENGLLPEVGPYFHLTTMDDYVVIPIPLRMDVNPHYTGKGITICFIDSGFYPHPDLTRPTNRILEIVDVTNPQQPTESACTGDSWHGTMTSVVCGGNGYLSRGLYKGIASEAQLVLVKVKDGGGISAENIEKAIRWTIRNREKYNIRIINLSVTDDYPVSFRKSLVDQAAEDAVRAGIVVVAAVGNDPHQSIKPPANSPNVIAVGGVDDQNMLGMMSETLYHSTYGTTVDGFQKPELIAPSIWLAAPILPGSAEHRYARSLYTILDAEERNLKNVLAAQLDNAKFTPSFLVDNSELDIREAVRRRVADAKYISPDYMHVDGTSFAAPIVCSVVAQMLEANSRLTPRAVREILVTSARKLHNRSIERQGYGVVNAKEAVLRAENEDHDFSDSWPNTPIIDRFNHKIIFYYHHHNAAQVTLAGSFNDWAPDSILFERQHTAIWKAEIPMLPKGVYFYKFVVDNKLWVDDPENLHRESDGHNAFNSKFLVE